MGGGTILILSLSLFIGIEQHIAQGTNLIFFIPTSISAIIINIKQKIIDFEIAVPITICGVIGALIGAKISNELNASTLKKYFGIFLLIITLWEIYHYFNKYILKKNTHNNTDKKIQS